MSRKAGASPDPRKLGCAHKGLGSRGWGWDGKVCVVGREMGFGENCGAGVWLGGGTGFMWQLCLTHV